MIHIASVNYLLGDRDNDLYQKPLKVFAPHVCQFLEDLSGKIMQHPFAKQYPDLFAFAYWIRKANIKRLIQNYKGDRDALGRGLCLHIAPSNIPINFAFSYVFGLLAGNANIVRLPSKAFAQTSLLCEIIQTLLTDYPDIKKRSCFVTYPKDSEATATFSQYADIRMIWGGDQTISQIRSLRTKARCLDIPFPDRYSIAIIDAKAILACDGNSLKSLAENFYNDTYLMDQNACSSPQMIYWLNDVDAAKEKFWNAVYMVAQDKYTLQDQTVIDKFTRICSEGIDNIKVKSVKKHDNLLMQVTLKEIDQDVVKLRGYGGYFYEYSLSDLSQLWPLVTEKYQTITYFGVDPNDLKRQIIEKHCQGIDRIVPIGKALDMDIIWDGYDLIQILSRQITI